MSRDKQIEELGDKLTDENKKTLEKMNCELSERHAAKVTK